jgi:hypothetical protein
MIQEPSETVGIVINTLLLALSGNVYVGALANGGEVLELLSVSTLVGPGNTQLDEAFMVKIGGYGLCAGKFIKFQTNVNSSSALSRSFSMLTAAYISGQKVAIHGAYNNSNCDLGSQVRFIKTL